MRTKPLFNDTGLHNPNRIISGPLMPHEASKHKVAKLDAMNGCCGWGMAAGAGRIQV